MKESKVEEFLRKVDRPWGMSMTELEQFQNEVKQLKSELNDWKQRFNSSEERYKSFSQNSVECIQKKEERFKKEQNKVAVEKLEELRARFDNSPIIFFHDTELNEKERAIVRDEYEDAKFIFRDNIDQLLAELKGESDEQC